MEVSLPEEAARRDAHCVCGERLRSWRQKGWVEGDVELTCPQITDVEGPLPGTPVLADRNILLPLQVSLKGKRRKVCLKVRIRRSKGGVNGNQLKFFSRTWSMPRSRPNVPLF
jgi:hypothetical protein